MDDWDDNDHYDETKRNHHNQLEKQRRSHIKSSCEGLKAHLFFGKDAKKKKSKATVLQTATRIISQSRQHINALPKDIQRSVLLKCDKFYKKLTRLSDKIINEHSLGLYDEDEMFKDYLTMKHMLRVLNRLPPQFLQLFAVEGVNKKANFAPFMVDDADAENEERMFQALGGDLKLDEESDDDGSALKSYFRNNPEAFYLIFKPDSHEVILPDSDSESEVDVENVDYGHHSRSAAPSGSAQRYDYRRPNKRKRSYSSGSGTSESEVSPSPESGSPSYANQPQASCSTSDSDSGESSSDEMEENYETYSQISPILGLEDSTDFNTIPTQIKLEGPDIHSLCFAEDSNDVAGISAIKFETPESPTYYNYSSPDFEAECSHPALMFMDELKPSPSFDSHFDNVLMSPTTCVESYPGGDLSEFVDPFSYDDLPDLPLCLPTLPSYETNEVLNTSFDVDQFLNPLPGKE